MFVYYVTIQVPSSNKYDIEDLYQELVRGQSPQQLILLASQRKAVGFPMENLGNVTNREAILHVSLTTENTVGVHSSLNESIPMYLALEGGNGNGCLYVICVKKEVLYEKIIKKYDFIIYKSVMAKIEETHYNRNYRVILPNGSNSSNLYKLDLDSIPRYDQGATWDA